MDRTLLFIIVIQMNSIRSSIVWFQFPYPAPTDDVELIETVTSSKPTRLRPMFSVGLPTTDADDEDDGVFNVDSILIPEFHGPVHPTSDGFDPFFGINFGFVNRVQGEFESSGAYDSWNGD